MDIEVPLPEDRFYQNVVDLIQLIQDLVSTAFNQGYDIINPALVMLGGAFLANYNRVKLIQNFINYSHKHYWDEIHARQESFFDKHAAEIFKDLPVNNVNAFKTLFTLTDRDGTHIINRDDRDAIWDFFGCLIRICIKYVHEGRRPSVKTDATGNKTPVYTNHFFDEVDLEYHAEKWDVKLKFSK